MFLKYLLGKIKYITNFELNSLFMPYNYLWNTISAMQPPLAVLQTLAFSITFSITSEKRVLYTVSFKQWYSSMIPILRLESCGLCRCIASYCKSIARGIFRKMEITSPSPILRQTFFRDRCHHIFLRSICGKFACCQTYINQNLPRSIIRSWRKPGIAVRVKFKLLDIVSRLWFLCLRF